MGENGKLDMRYHHVNLAGKLRIGGRYGLEEARPWTRGGRLVLEEVAD